MKLLQAGQVGFFEWILIIIGILWLAGYLRNTIYVPVVIKEKDREKEEEKKTKINEDTVISKPKDKDQNGDAYTPFEEIKD